MSQTRFHANLIWSSARAGSDSSSANGLYSSVLSIKIMEVGRDDGFSLPGDCGSYIYNQLFYYQLS